jgi:hypothetical protein
MDVLQTPPPFVRDTPSTVASTPGWNHKHHDAPPLPWGPAPYSFYDPYGAAMAQQQSWDYMTWMGAEGMQFPSTHTLDAMRAASAAAGMFSADVSSMNGSPKKERKRGTRNKIGPSELSNPSRPRLQELRNLPQRGLGLRWVSDDRKFQVVKLQQSTTSGSPGPAATVVRPDPEGVLEATGGSKLPSLDEVKGSVVCWAVDNWQARRYEADADAKVWNETESVPLDKNESGSQEEWARRFSQREKQLLVGKGTRGYRRFLRMIPKQARKTGDPQTPRVAEQCSKRAFDGRLKQWRILLHAFSPRDSEDEGDDPNDADGIREQVPNPQELMEELSLREFGDLVSTKIPPTPPKPLLQMSPSKTDSKDEKFPGTPSRQTMLRKSPAKSPVGSSAVPSPGPRSHSAVMSPMLQAPPATPARPSHLTEGGSPTALSNAGTPLGTVPAFPFPNFADNFPNGVMFDPSPLPSPGNMAPPVLPNNFADALLPEFEEMLKRMGNIDSENFVQDLNKLFLNEFPGVGGDLDNSAQELLPTGLLETQLAEAPTVDLESTLDRAQVPAELKPIFKEAFGNVDYAFSKPHDEREVILATAARAVIGTMPPSEQAPLKVLDTLLAFLNELRITYSRAPDNES